jgi:hypothetical protein
LNSKELCIKNDYFCKVTKHDIDNAIIAYFPKDIIYGYDNDIIKYTFGNNILNIEDKNGVIKTYHTPNYSLRVMVIIHLFIKNSSRNLDTSLCVYYNSNSERQDGGIKSILPSFCINDKEAEQERNLASLTINISESDSILDNIEHSKKLGVTEGYSNIISLFEEEC